MISPVTQSSSSSTATGSSQSASRTQLGQDEFLSLLVTQLRNQDPLSPLQPYEFAAQLAQFSSVEQLTQLNDQVATEAQMAQLSALLGKTNFGATLIGRQVLAQDNQVTVPQDAAAQVRIEVGTGGGRGTLTLLDSSGKTVATRDLGRLDAGMQTLTLPSDLPAGNYRYAVKVTSDAGQDVGVTPYVLGVVSGVLFKDGAIQLKIGALEVPIDSVTEVTAAPAPASSP